MLPYTLHQHNLWSSCFHTHCTNTIYGAHTSIHIAPTQFMELMLPYTLYQHILWSSCFHTHCTNTFYGAHASIYIAPTRFATLIPLCAIPTMCPLYPQSTYLNVYLAISLPEILYIHRISSDFPAKNTVHTPYIWRFPCQNYCTYTGGYKKEVVDVTSNFWVGALKGPPTPLTPQILPPLGRKGYQSASVQILHPSASKGNTINVSVRRCESKTDSEHPYACLH